MMARFAKVGVEAIMHPGVPLSDPRIAGRGLIDHTQKCWSCMYGHLDMIREFLATDAAVGIFCEDDILLDAGFKDKLEHIIGDFTADTLDGKSSISLLGNEVPLFCDTMLLGYLVNAPVTERTHRLNAQSIYVDIDSGNSCTFKYFEYGMDVWGTQMYMLSRRQAQRLLNKYGFPTGFAPSSVSYADEFLANPSAFELPFSADWTITKDCSKKYIVYPMLAIEDGLTSYDHDGQTEFHLLAHSAHVGASTYI
jgi:GR25 family glycosyltransferase involved in LPS biosynthesis